ncbi:unnamed protein product [Caenorhabditis brenneri]
MSLSFKCLDCAQLREFRSEAELEAHIAGDHLQMMVYSCELCADAMFPTEFSMIQHYAKSHKITSGFNLNVCYSEELREQREVLAGKLQRCIATGDLPEVVDLTMVLEETPIDPVKCLYCPGSVLYSSKESLETHIAKIHLKMAPFRCDQCEYAMFPSQFTLARHQFEHHNGASDTFKMIVSSSPQVQQKRWELAEKLKMCLNNTRPEEEKPLRDVLSFNHDDNDTEITAPAVAGEVINESNNPPPNNDNDTAAAGAFQRFFNLHSRNPRIQCGLCHKLVTSSYKRSHAVTHGHLVIFECNVCSRQFRGLKNMELVKKHMTEHVQNGDTTNLKDFSDYRHLLQEDIDKLVIDCFP